MCLKDPVATTALTGLHHFMNGNISPSMSKSNVQKTGEHNTLPPFSRPRSPLPPLRPDRHLHALLNTRVLFRPVLSLQRPSSQPRSLTPTVN